MTDPDVQRAVERARAGIARLLEGRLLPGMDADHIAGQIVERLHADNWRPIPRPHVADDQFDQDRFDRGLARAKAILRGEDPDNLKETNR